MKSTRHKTRLIQFCGMMNKRTRRRWFTNQ